jgi:hypothetical protein
MWSQVIAKMREQIKGGASGLEQLFNKVSESMVEIYFTPK